jgi:hypothetical protein
VSLPYTQILSRYFRLAEFTHAIQGRGKTNGESDIENIVGGLEACPSMPLRAAIILSPTAEILI